MSFSDLGMHLKASCLIPKFIAINSSYERGSWFGCWVSSSQTLSWLASSFDTLELCTATHMQLTFAGRVWPLSGYKLFRLANLFHLLQRHYDSSIHEPSCSKFTMWHFSYWLERGIVRCWLGASHAGVVWYWQLSTCAVICRGYELYSVPSRMRIECLENLLTTCL